MGWVFYVASGGIIPNFANEKWKAKRKELKPSVVSVNPGGYSFTIVLPYSVKLAVVYSRITVTFP